MQKVYFQLKCVPQKLISPISSKIILTKEKERRKSEKEEKRRREKSNGCTLSFDNGYFGDNVLACLTQKVHLVVNVFKKCSFCFFGLFEFLNYY